MKACIVYGTRPEMIKLSVLSKDYVVDGVYTGQQPDLAGFYSSLMEEPVHRVEIPPGDLNLRYSHIMRELPRSIENYETVIVQGDTLTAAAAAHCAFHMGKKIAHVEAGLRTGNIRSPFPEELCRNLISRLAEWSFCPTETSAKNLLSEKVPGKIHITGNTVVDAVNRISRDRKAVRGDEVIVTLHRRENIPHLPRLLQSIKRMSETNSDLRWTLPVHPNPEVRRIVTQELSDSSVSIVPPFEYHEFIERIRTCRALVTDSGGIQEEAACFGKRVVICRESTERPEGIDAGFAVIGFDNTEKVIQEIIELPLWDGKNPYGDGSASNKIAEILKLERRK